MGKAAQKCISRLAEILAAESRGQPKSIVTAWMRCRLSFSLLRSAILCVTLPLLESYLNWVADPMPPPTRRLADLTSPASSENTLPADSSRKLPRRLRPRRLEGSSRPPRPMEIQHPAWLTQRGPSANENSASSAVTRPRSTGNRNSPFPGPQRTSRSPRSALMKHPQTFQPSQHPQHPRSTTNENAERRPRLDHPEIRGVYKPAQHSIRQDTLTSIHRNSFSGSGLSSPALQRPHRDSFSESPSGQLNEKSVTDSREVRIARGQRPGFVYPLPRATRPDTRLTIDAALPEAADLPLWTSQSQGSWRKLAVQDPPNRVDRARPGANPANGPGIAPLEYSGPRSALHTTATGVSTSLLLI